MDTLYSESFDGVDKNLYFEDVADEFGMNYNSNNFKCIKSWEAHNGQVYCVTSLGNMLYSSSNKTFKVWSLDNLACISEINAHSGLIKSMVVWPEKNILATASDKIINLWDLVSLQVFFYY